MARSRLIALQECGALEKAHVYADIMDVDGYDIKPLDIITGGFPCPDISTAGHMLGLSGTKSSLFIELLRVAIESEAEILFLENVANIISKNMRVMFGQLMKLIVQAGFRYVKWITVRGYNVGSPQSRARWFCLCCKSAASLEKIASLTPDLSSEDIKQLSQKKWNPQTSLPMHQYLTHKYDKESLSLVGNCVIPQCAALALGIIVHK